MLVSIQALIFVEQPYFNEPGYERDMGSSYGRSQSDTYNQNIQHETVRVAMIGMLQDPPFGFEEIIRQHFKLKKEELKDQLAKWSVQISQVAQLQKALEQL